MRVGLSGASLVLVDHVHLPYISHLFLVIVTVWSFFLKENILFTPIDPSLNSFFFGPTPHLILYVPNCPIFWWIEIQVYRGRFLTFMFIKYL